MRAFYHGCWKASGHYLFKPDGDWPKREEEPPQFSRHLDGGFCPNAPAPRSGGHTVDERHLEVQTQFKLTHEQGWTIISCWDRTVDHRYNSNATFVLEGVHTFAEAIDLARQHFPHIMERLEKAAPLTLR